MHAARAEKIMNTIGLKMFTSIVFNLISKIKGKTILSTKIINENIYAVQCGYVNFYIYH